LFFSAHATVFGAEELSTKSIKGVKGFFFFVLCAFYGRIIIIARIQPVDTTTGIRYIRIAASAARYQWSSVRVLCTPDGRACPAFS
jgi:hypothetical protein